MKTKFLECRQHIEEIREDVTELVENRYVLNRMREILKPNEAITNNLFFDHYVVNYASTMASGIRRQIDHKTSRGGLKKLMEIIIINPEIVNKKFYVEHYTEAGLPYQLGEKSWSEKYGGNEFIDKTIVQADLLELENLTSKVKDFVDKRIAHKDKEWADYKLTYGELDKALDTLEKLTIKYYELFTGGGMTTLVPTIQYPWEDIFREPWVKQ